MSAGEVRQPVFVIDQRAHVWDTPVGSVTEHDIVMVRIHTTNSAAPGLRVIRQSPLRGIGVGWIVGGENAVAAVRANNAGDACVMDVQFRDLAPGTAVIAIRNVVTQNNVTTDVLLGSFDFRVEPVPIGAFSVGPTRLELSNPTFNLLKTAGDTVITADNQSARMQYAIFYSPYLWERRPGSFRALSVTVGTSLTAVKDNVMFGVSYELPRGVTLHSGLHFGRVTTVDPRLGVDIDGSVSGLGLSDVPTTSSWQRGWFYSVGLDPRILGQLFRVGAGAAVPDR